MQGTRVTVGDWSVDTAVFLDVFGCEWILESLGGWFDSPAVRSSPIARPGADGVWDGLPTQDARTITVAGSVRAPGPAELLAALDRVSGLLAGSLRYDTLTVREGARGVSRQAIVRLGNPTLSNPKNSCAASFSLSLFAPDPKRYSAELHSAMVAPFAPGAGRSYDLGFDRSYGSLGAAGILQVTNSGTRDTAAIFSVPGPVTNPTIRLAGAETMQVMIDLPAGLTLAVDTGDRSVLIGGASRRQLMSRDEFFLLPPGDSTIYYATDAGGDPLTVQWRDAS